MTRLELGLAGYTTATPGAARPPILGADLPLGDAPGLKGKKVRGLGRGTPRLLIKRGDTAKTDISPMSPLTGLIRDQGMAHRNKLWHLMVITLTLRMIQRSYHALEDEMALESENLTKLEVAAMFRQFTQETLPELLRQHLPQSASQSEAPIGLSQHKAQSPIQDAQLDISALSEEEVLKLD